MSLGSNHIFESLPTPSAHSLKSSLVRLADYDVLGLVRTASSEDVKKAYRKLALKWHPERADESKPEVLARFDSIAEAYEVLSNPARRAIFDQYGESGLKNGIPDGHGGVKGGKYQFNNNALEIFAGFFGTSRCDVEGRCLLVAFTSWSPSHR